MQKKLDSLNVTDKSRTTKEVVIEESVSDSGKQRKTIVLEDNSPGSEMRIMALSPNKRGGTRYQAAQFLTPYGPAGTRPRPRWPSRPAPWRRERR